MNSLWRKVSGLSRAAVKAPLVTTLQPRLSRLLRRVRLETLSSSLLVRSSGGQETPLYFSHNI